MNNYRFFIGDLGIELQSQFPIAVQKNLQIFSANDSCSFTPDITYNVSKIPPSYQKTGQCGKPVFEQGYTRVYRTDRSLIIEDGVNDCNDYIIINNGDYPHPCALISSPNNKFYDISSSLNFPYILPAFEGIFLHASFIAWHGMGVLFSAPSGTGKSTQASLWQQLRGADIINGDKTLLRRSHSRGKWYAYGSPWAGSSHIYRNEKFPLRALVVLRQAQHNSIEHLEPFNAFKQLFSQTAAPLFDSALLGNTTELLEHLVSRVPVFLLSCRPDEGAVKALEDELLKL